MGAIKCFVGRNQKNWDMYLPQLAAALRASVNHSTGFTPNKIMLGREVDHPAELMFRPPGKEESIEEGKYVQELAAAMLKAHEIARENLKVSQLRNKRDYDLKVVSNQYCPGDLVYQLDTASVKGKFRKLSPSWKGRGVITRRITTYLYQVKFKKTVLTPYHDRFKLCRDRDVPIREGDNIFVPSAQSAGKVYQLSFRSCQKRGARQALRGSWQAEKVTSPMAACARAIQEVDKRREREKQVSGEGQREKQPEGVPEGKGGPDPPLEAGKGRRWGPCCSARRREQAASSPSREGKDVRSTVGCLFPG